MNFEKQFEEPEEIEITLEKWGILDDDVENWAKTLKEGGMNQEEIDRILSNLNRKYKNKIIVEKANYHSIYEGLKDDLTEEQKRKLYELTTEQLFPSKDSDPNRNIAEEIEKFWLEVDNEKLLTYIQFELASKVSKETIVQNLLSDGWPKDTVEYSFSLLELKKD